jgi:hypothetical protein
MDEQENNVPSNVYHFQPKVKTLSSNWIYISALAVAEMWDFKGIIHYQNF